MIIAVIESTQHLRRNMAVIFFLHHLSQHVACAQHCFHQRAVSQVVHFRHIHQKLPQVVFHHNTQFFFRKSRFLDNCLHHLQSLRQVFVQRIKGYIRILHAIRQLQPCSIVIQLFCYFGCCHPLRTFAQHPVGKQRLQRLCLSQQSSCHHHVNAYHFVVTGIQHIQFYAVGHYSAYRFLNVQVFRTAYRRLYVSVQHCFFKNSSALSRSCGVSIPIVSTFVIPALMV